MYSTTDVGYSVIFFPAYTSLGVDLLLVAIFLKTSTAFLALINA
jgi:hypothetical protein